VNSLASPLHNIIYIPLYTFCYMAFAFLNDVPALLQSAALINGTMPTPE